MSGESTEKSVTIIVAAYLRAASLNRTLRSVYRQTHKNWQVLVVADCCDDAFLSLVDRSDPRVRVINLPARCGSQYGPNSVGIHFADTDYIAFLNHDDLWLEDHLELALQTLDQEHADIYLGRSAFCDPVHQEQEGQRLIFAEANAPEMIWRVFHGPNWLFEPASSWVVATPQAKRVGHWHPPSIVRGTPVMDWLQRCVRAGLKFCHSDMITTLKFNLGSETATKKVRYHGDVVRNDEIEELNSMSADNVRRLTTEDIETAKAEGRSLRWNAYHQDNAQYDSAVKTYFENRDYEKDVAELGAETQVKQRDDWLAIVERRTGERLTGFVDADRIIESLDV